MWRSATGTGIPFCCAQGLKVKDHPVIMVILGNEFIKILIGIGDTFFKRFPFCAKHVIFICQVLLFNGSEAIDVPKEQPDGGNQGKRKE